MNSQFKSQEYRNIIKELKQAYDALAEVFDYFYSPLELKKSLFIQLLHKFLKSNGIDKILDCACGTGRELIPLAMTGTYDLIVGSDLSPKMLEQAKKKSTDLPIKWVESEWTEILQKVKYRNFDAIICLGNPMAHVPSWSFKEIFSSIIGLIRKDGLFLLNRRNSEAELGINKFKFSTPRTTIYSSFDGFDSSDKLLPRISLLNICDKNEKEFLAYFTYHFYNIEYRIQLLHLIECDLDRILSHRTFEFKTFFEKEADIKRALFESGFKEVQEVDFLEGIDNFDDYAEERFLCAKK